MSVPARMAGIPEGGVGDDRLIKALSLGRNNMQELVSIANGAPPKNGVDSMYAVIALNLLKPIKQAQQERQAQQPKQPSVKDQVVAEAAPHAQMAGIAALPQADSVMPEHAMAAGGIVAFASGDEVESMTKEDFLALPKEQRDRVIQTINDQRLLMKPISAFNDFLGGPYNAAAAATTGVANAVGVPRIGRALGIYGPDVTSVEVPRVGTGTATPFFDKYRNEVTEDQYVASLPSKKAKPGETKAPAPAPATAATTAPATTTTPGAAGTPGGPSAAKPDAGLPLLAVDSGVPAGGPSPLNSSALFSKFETLAKKAGSDIKNVDIGTIAKLAEKDPELSKLFGYTADQYKDLFKDSREALLKQIPESEAAERKKIQEREAGLEALSAKRGQRAGEAYARAEKESNVGKGEALMALAGTLVSTPRNDPRFSAGITNFTSMLGSVRKDLSKAAGERDKALDLIEESNELRKVGQFEKAEATYKEGQRRLFDFNNTVNQGAIASDVARNSNVLNYAGKKAEQQVRGIEAQLSTLTKGLGEAAATERTVFEVGSRAQVAAMQDRTNREIANLEARVKQNVYELAYGSKEARAINDALDTASKAFKNLAEKNLNLVSDPVAASNEFRNQQQIALRAAGLDDARIKQILGATSGGGVQDTGYKVIR